MSKLPTGVEIRGKYIRIWFMFRGKRCRETLKGWEITNSNIKKAGNLRALIVHEINSGEFEYLRRFPQHWGKNGDNESHKNVRRAL